MVQIAFGIYNYKQIISKVNINMRERYKNILKIIFYEKLAKENESKKLTQAKMSEIFVMSERNYFELANGNTGCSALTLALFLIYICSDPVQFLSELKQAFENTSD